jgi:hypothetical protein
VLDLGEPVILQAPARWRTTGTLVLTTRRVLFVEPPDRILFDRLRTDVRGVERATGALTILFDDRRVEVWLASVREWVEEMRFPIPPYVRTSGGPFDAVLDDPRIGVVDTARRLVLREWERMMAFRTIIEPERWLDGVVQTPVRWDDIVEIVYIVDGCGDGPSWVLIARLADRRWVYFSHLLQITGEVYSAMVIAPSLESVWWGAVSESERDRLTAQMTAVRREEELVQLDAFLESDDAALRSRAELRMLQRHRRAR